ncbi:MAG: electron transport complex subunit RsxE [Myxococcales bacterium]|nr:electron transport complex subunit RsxE [Myxococcales bacterium]
MANAIEPDEGRSRAAQELLKGIWRENPVFIAVLGLCPAMAVTNSLLNGIVMGLATMFVLMGSSLLVSMLRGVIPKQVRISVFIIIIASFVTTVDFVLQAIAYEVHKEIGAFIALIVVNCLILGRQEAFASKHPMKLALADAVGMSLGFALALTMIGGIREILGNGSLLGVPLLGDSFEPWVIMILPPGGFLTLGLLLTIFAWFKARAKARAALETKELSHV